MVTVEEVCHLRGSSSTRNFQMPAPAHPRGFAMGTHRPTVLGTDNYSDAASARQIGGPHPEAGPAASRGSGSRPPARTRTGPETRKAPLREQRGLPAAVRGP
ncbi:hypothetical protein GCM10022377_09440 [Zhihengliuella alba]|uniref:Uncharacterized protein n=1 Tax=Zhihengliuella alba TaxID=547018 RepID=A0ABP7D5C2_9MICC